MVPFIEDAFAGTEAAEFFRGIIPVSMDIWILFFLIPFVLALLIQLLLCFRARRVWVKLLPLFAAVFIPAAVFVCRYADVFQRVIGGFVGLILIGSAAFIAAGSLAGWAVFAVSALRKNRRGGSLSRAEHFSPRS